MALFQPHFNLKHSSRYLQSSKEIRDAVWRKAGSC